MCFHMLNFCWSNTKRFFSVLVVFGKYFVFTKSVKFFKKVLPCSGDLVAGQSSCMSPVVSSYSSFSRLIGKSLSQLQSRVLHINFRGSLHGFLASGTFSCKKYLENFFKNSVSGVSRLILVTCFSHENCVFFILRVILKVVFKNFSLLPHASLSLIIPSSLALYILLDPFVYSCQKGGEYTLE